MLALVLVAAALMPVTARAGWGTMTTRNSQPAGLEAEAMLRIHWEEGLNAANALYGTMLWALDYIDAWTENTTWEHLACARAACILVSGYLNEFDYPELALSGAQMAELAEADVVTDVLAEYYAPDEDRLMMYSFFRKHLLPSLDTEAVWAYELESVKDLSAAMRTYLRLECDILRYATNYLFLPLYDQAKGEAAMKEWKQACPVVFSPEAAWISDGKKLESINAEISDAALPEISNELNAVILRAIARSENAIIDATSGDGSKRLAIQGQPDSLPVPLWYDPELAGFLVFCYDGNRGLSYPACGDALTKDNSQIYLRQPGVSLEEVEAYLEWAASYARKVERKDNSWTILMRGYGVSVSWEKQTVTMVFMGESSTLLYK